MEVITDPDVEAVWICSPSQFHADQIKAAAKAGKHIFCEKPIATDLAGTIEAVQVCFLTAKVSIGRTERTSGWHATRYLHGNG